MTDFYKKACNESNNDCSDFDAANALLMIKSANETKTVKKPNTCKKRALSQEFASCSKKQNSFSIENKKLNKKTKSSSQTPCPNDDHTYSNALKKQQEEQVQQQKQANSVAISENKRKCRKKSEPSKVENVDEINNYSDTYSFNSDSDCFDFCDTNENTRSTIASQYSNASDSDRISTVSADTLRNALLELSRAAEMVEDNDDVKTNL